MASVKDIKDGVDRGVAELEDSSLSELHTQAADIVSCVREMRDTLGDFMQKAGALCLILDSFGLGETSEHVAHGAAILRDTLDGTTNTTATDAVTAANFAEEEVLGIVGMLPQAADECVEAHKILMNAHGHLERVAQLCQPVAEGTKLAANAVNVAVQSSGDYRNSI